MIDWIIKMLIGIVLCRISYSQGYSDGCCESYERQLMEYIKKHAPKLYEELRKRKEGKKDE